MRTCFKSALSTPLFVAALAMLSTGTAQAATQPAHAHAHEPQAQEGHAAHGAHVHGQGQLMLATDGESLEVMVELTAADLLGFEHAPATDAEQQSWQRLAQQLKAGAWLSLPAEAACQLTAQQLTEPWAGSKAGHSDISLTLTLQCQKPGALQQVDLKAFFTLVPGLELLSVQWVHQGRQGAARLQPAASLLQFSAG